MEITSKNTFLGLNNTNPTSIKVDFTKKISQEDVKELKDTLKEQSKSMMLTSLSIQSNVVGTEDRVLQNQREFTQFLNDIGYEGGSIASLSQEEAKKLVSEDGIFGVKQTSQRIANFVLKGAGEEESLLKAGREGILQGYTMAEEMWGGELPEISQLSIQKATEMIDMKLSDLGFSIIDTEV